MATADGTCPVGDHPFTYEIRGTPTIYCSPAHRQKARVMREKTQREVMTERWCARGQHTAPTAEFSSTTAPYCRPHMAEFARESRAANPDPLRARRETLSRYGLTPETFTALLASQCGRCAICGTSEPGGQGWHVDHDHACHARKQACDKCRRGILCDRCNIAIGNFRDDPVIIQSALDYLTAYRARVLTS